MADRILHRGPDGEGFRVGPGYGLAHRRLAIVDIAGGAQPMHDGGSLWVTFGGEIYNHRDLRKELEAAGFHFKTNCDTEVLLHGYRAWGESLPERLRGMFAFVIVDEASGHGFAARDRLGKKPFYYAEVAGDLLFGSEPKALLEDPRLSRELDPEAIEQFFALRYVPEPNTAFAAIKKLPAGCRMSWRDGRIQISPYWNLSFAEQRSGSVESLGEQVCEILDEAVKIRLMGEVPIGAFLSAGIDSYAIVESMSRVGEGETVTCSVGFDHPEFDERQGARLAAQAVGAKLFEDEIRVEDMLELDWFGETFDEPFSDVSAIPSYHVSSMAQRHVTVALSGDGGDESFAGYRRYHFDQLENRWRRILPSIFWRCLGSIYPKADFLPRYLRFKRTLQNLALSPAEAYARSVSAVLPEELRGLIRRPTGADPLLPIRRAYADSDAPDSLSRCMATDFKTWLPGDVLQKVDRASMAVSLEVRCPLLDHKLVEFAAGIPAAMKLANGQTKAFFRRALAKRLSAEALSRPKQGFTMPVRDWLMGSLGNRMSEVLDDEILNEHVDGGHLRRLLEQHRAGLRDNASLLWGSLVLHGFLRRWAS
jgi:asparagine synthase (glutamine-hydrolysing)